MGGEHLDVTAGVDRALDAGGAELVAPQQPSLHQGSLLGQQLPPLGRRHRQAFQRLAQQPAAFGRAAFGQGQGLELQRRVALAAEALVELDDAALQIRMGLPQLRRHLRQAVEVMHQAAAGRMGYAAAGEQLTAARLAAPVAQSRISAQQRHLQQLGEALFQLGDHVAGDEAAARPEQLLDAGQQGGALQQLFGQRPAGGIVGVKQVQPLAGMGGGHTGQQLQHRIHDQIGQQLAGDVDHPHAGIPQPDQGEELPLLVVVGSGDQLELGPVDRQRG